MINKINIDGVDHDIVGKDLTKVTYSELKALRDNGQLSEGHLYRITDYVTTTTQTNTKSAGNVFDVIVLAVSANELSHIARAIQHEGDTYFDGNDLGAWELWYDLDNDTEKYAWADATNGKGVIYRMIDEKRNDCPYDFKNILFYNTKFVDNTTDDKYYYTFSNVVSNKLYDVTAEKQVTKCYNNRIGEYISNKKKKLNKNVFRNISGTVCYNNIFDSGCDDNTFGDYCCNNTFGPNSYDNIFQDDCLYNTFGSNCSGNRLGKSCANNTFGSSCTNNTLGYNCDNNTFGYNCYNNTFGNNCNFNTFGTDCFLKQLNNNVSHRHYNYKHITLNEEYYDDGSGQLVSIKHPDLSTQPSILPYKFMGQYVYEILLPIPDIDISKSQYSVNASQLLEYVKDLSAVAILQAEELLFCYKKSSNYPSIPVFLRRNVSIYTIEQYGGTGFYDLVIIPNINQHVNTNSQGGVVKAYLRIVYTSMPEEGGDYYGYNNY